MPTLHPGILKNQAKTRLQDSNASRLVLIHTGLVLCLSLIASGINLYLSHQINSTGGLSGLSTRSMLQSLQTLLQYGTTIFTPFWHAGFTLAVLSISRGLAATTKDLLGGFRRWGTVLSLQMGTMMLYFGALIASAYLASMIYSVTPFAESMTQLLTPMMESGSVDLTALPMEEMIQVYTPLMIIFLAVLLPICLLLSLGTRLSPYLILDQNMAGFLAIPFSIAAMRGKKWKMLKLDLSFWWYYLAETLLAIVCYLDVILPMLGVQLPFNETVAFFGALILYAVLELGFHLWKKPYHDVTYALAYQEILHSLEIPKEST